jgi:hypothetical protein
MSTATKRSHSPCAKSDKILDTETTSVTDRVCARVPPGAISNVYRFSPRALFGKELALVEIKRRAAHER